MTRQLDNPELTATEWCIALGWSRAEFFRHKPKPQGRRTTSYGRVSVFAFRKLPLLVGAAVQLLRQRSTSPRDDLATFVRVALQDRRRSAVMRLLQQRMSPAPDAVIRREALLLYFRALDNGATEEEANRRARSFLTKHTGRSVTDRQIRRIARKVDECGGADLAPLDAYSTAKSVSHARSSGRKHHGGPGTPGPHRVVGDSLDQHHHGR